MASARVEGLEKSFGSVRALNGVTLDVPDGSFFVVLGPSGAGKTTTLRAIAGLEKLDAGPVYLDGRDATGDAPAARDLAMVFQTARLAGWVDDGVRLEHVSFGMILGRDKKRLKTRAGDSIRLGDLLDEAVERAARVVEEKSPALDPAARARIAAAVGIGAVKYGDLSSDRVKDYVFDWDRMLALDGNTAPYLQYAYTRIVSLFRRGQVWAEELKGAVSLEAPAERALALVLARFQETVDDVADTALPHYLCSYL